MSWRVLLSAALVAGIAASAPASAESITDILNKHSGAKGGQKDKTEVLPGGAKRKTVQDDLTDECDRLTAADFDQDLPSGVRRVFFDDIDPRRAIPACKSAMEAHPDDRRMVFQLGRAYDAAKRYADAAPLYDRAAAMGSVAAMNNVGAQYYEGRGRRRDYEEAFAWFSKAADRSSSRAVYNLGILYMDGNGVAADPDEAARLFIRSVEGKAEDLIRRFGQKTYFTPPVVRRIQRHLIEKGYMDGKPDGEIGPATMRAMKAWQQDIGF